MLFTRCLNEIFKTKKPLGFMTLVRRIKKAVSRNRRHKKMVDDCHLQFPTRRGEGFPDPRGSGLLVSSCLLGGSGRGSGIWVKVGRCCRLGGSYGIDCRHIHGAASKAEERQTESG